MTANNTPLHLLEITCDQRNCPALAAKEIEICGQDFKFCQHHYNKLLPVLLVKDVKQSSEQEQAAKVLATAGKA